MTRKHKINLIPYGSLKDLVELNTNGPGEKIRVGNSFYTKRESGNLREDDPIRLSMLEGLLKQAELNPEIEHSSEIDLSENKGPFKVHYKIKFTRVEDTPNNELEEQNQTYISVQGTRYNVESQGSLTSTGLSINELIQKGKEAIEAYSSRDGKLPNGIEFGFFFEKEEQINSN
jgi:hypothetical protein